MTIEVKQLLIKSTVSSDTAQAVRSTQSGVSYDSIRDRILSDCRELFEDLLRAERER